VYDSDQRIYYFYAYATTFFIYNQSNAVVFLWVGDPRHNCLGDKHPGEFVGLMVKR